MSKITEVAINDRRSLNQAIIHASHMPERVIREPRVFIRALRSALRMSQAQLAARCKIPRARKRPGDAIAERGLRSDGWRYLRIWDEAPYWPLRR